MKRFFLFLLMLTLLTACAAQADSSAYDLTFTDREMEGTWKTKNAVYITGNGTKCEIDGDNAALADGILTLSADGVYILSGNFTDIVIMVSAGDEDKVQLVLDNATIESSKGPAIYLQNADKVFITLPEDSESLVSDGVNYTVTDGDTTLDAAIFSRADLCINGKGTLNVAGNYKHAIVSKDDLVIVHATLTINAASTALDGKDCVMLNGVSASITAGSNGIRSDNAEDEGRGYVYILDSTLTIKSGGDAVQAEKLLRADNAVMTLTTGNGSASVTNTGDEFGSGGGSGGGTSTTTSDGTSLKGLKSATELEINGGAYVIDTEDDCIHTNGNLTITDGLFTLSSGDDGIHADSELLISGGDFVITKSYEGIEASKLMIAGGTFDITASDDGLNAAGGVDGSGNNEFGGSGGFSSSRGEIIISGGYMHVNSSGDGIDANGNITVTGGVTLVSGPTAEMNSAFDYDGQAHVSGGILIATGSSGMAQSFSSAENQGCMFFSANNAPAGVNIAIVDENNLVVVSFTPDTKYSSVAVTAPGLQVGKTYYVIGGATIDGMDEFGFATGATYTGGTNYGSIKMTTTLQGGSGHSFGGGW